jgi:hypothetical protein
MNVSKKFVSLPCPVLHTPGPGWSSSPSLRSVSRDRASPPTTRSHRLEPSVLSPAVVNIRFSMFGVSEIELDHSLIICCTTNTKSVPSLSHLRLDQAFLDQLGLCEVLVGCIPQLVRRVRPPRNHRAHLRQPPWTGGENHGSFLGHHLSLPEDHRPPHGPKQPRATPRRNNPSRNIRQRDTQNHPRLHRNELLKTTHDAIEIGAVRQFALALPSCECVWLEIRCHIPPFLLFFFSLSLSLKSVFL